MSSSLIYSTIESSAGHIRLAFFCLSSPQIRVQRDFEGAFGGGLSRTFRSQNAPDSQFLRIPEQVSPARRFEVKSWSLT